MSITPSPINLEDFRAPSTKVAPIKRKRLPRHRRGEWFLKGPIPGVWVQSAASLSGKAFQVAIAAWHVGELVKSGTFKLSHKMLSQFGVKPTAARRGLAALKAAGLVEVEQRRGCSPLVTILVVKSCDIIG